MIANADALFKPLKIRNLVIRNRVMSTSHAPGYGVDGKPQERYQLYHAEKARGGIGLTMFGGSSSVAPDSPATPWHQISAADDSVVPYFRQFADRLAHRLQHLEAEAHPVEQRAAVAVGALIDGR